MYQYNRFSGHCEAFSYTHCGPVTNMFSTMSDCQMRCENRFIRSQQPCPVNQLVNCIDNPCATARCPLYPYAVCQVNYCGGCKAEFYINSEIVTCQNLPSPTTIQTPTTMGRTHTTPNWRRIFRTEVPPMSLFFGRRR